MEETFYAGGYWRARRETSEQCARRAAACLELLARVDDLFAHWYERGRSRKEALKHNVPPAPAVLKDLFHRGQNRQEDDGSVIADLGFRIGLWTGGTDSAGLNVLCGCYSEVSGILNSCVINLPDEGAAAERILRTVSATAILEAIVAVWSPEWAVVTSDNFRDLHPDCKVGWITYLPVEVNSLPPLTEAFRVSPAKDDGSLIALTNDRFSSENLAHVRAASKLEDKLRRAGLLPQFDF